MPHRFFLLPLITAFSLNSGYADWLDDTGKQELLDYLGLTALPTSTTDNVPVVQIEAGTSYLPTTTNFPQKTFFNVSNTSTGFSSHANTVAVNYYQNTTYAGGTSDVFCYSANDFLNNVLSTSTTEQLIPLDGVVASNAWIGNSPSRASIEAQVGSITDAEYDAYLAQYADNFVIILNKYDYLSSTGNTLMVSGLNNGANSITPLYFPTSYNGLTVGITSGNHSKNNTLEGHPTVVTDIIEAAGITMGRTKPDLVSSASFTSFATGQVCSGATYLYGLAETLGQTDVTSQPSVQRAIMMAGATKEEFPAWENMSTNPTNLYPLDPDYGAGEMNVFHTHRIVEAGTPSSSNIGFYGWDYNAPTTTADQTYTITIPAGVSAADLSVVLCWDREIAETISQTGNPRRPTTNYSYDSSPLVDLRLELTGPSTSTFSDSTIDNVEHIYAQALPAGTYQLTVSNNSGTLQDYGLAWRINVDATTLPCTAVSETGLDLADLIPGLRYDIEESTTLTSWTQVDTFTPTTTTHTWTDPAPSSTTEKFFRLRFWD